MAPHTTPQSAPQTTADELADLLGTTPEAEEKPAKKARAKKKNKLAAKWPPKKGSNGEAPSTEAPAKAATRATPAKAATKAKAPAKKSAKAPVKATSKAKPAAKARAERKPSDGKYAKHVASALTKLKAMKRGSAATTRELSEQHGIPPYAFLSAAHKMVEEKLCKVRNNDRINTITRL